MTDTTGATATSALVEPASEPLTGRIHGLDVWRAILLCYGVLVHASTASDGLVAVWIRDISAQVRMEGFFFVSGLLAAVTIRRAAPGTWLPRRLVTLTVPLALGLLVLNPVGLWIIARSSAGPGFMHGYADHVSISWHLHLWFLICLVGFSVVTSLVWRIGDRSGPRRWLPRLQALLRFRFVVFALLAAVLVAARYAGNASVHLIPGHFSTFPVAVFPYYLGFYLLGFFCATSDAIRTVVVRPSQLALGLAMMLFVAVLAYRLVPGGMPGGSAARLLCKAWIGLAACSLILRHALTLHLKGQWAFRLSAAAFTVYLLHYDLLQLMLWSFSDAGTAVAIAFPVAFVGATVVTFLFHDQVVRRQPVLGFLVNGRLPRRAPDAIGDART